MAIVKTEVKADVLPRLRPRKIAPAPAPAPAPVPILARKRKIEESKQVVPLKRTKKETTVKKELKPKRVTAAKKESVPKSKKVSTRKPNIEKKPEVKKATPKVKKPSVVHKLPPEARIYMDNGMRGRVLRAMKQRMYVLSRELSSLDDTVETFEVLGSIGNSYTVTFGSSIKCTCMDHRIRKTHCKHILMVLLKVYRLGFDNPMFQRLTTSRDERMDARSGGRIVDPSVLVPTKVRERILKLTHGGEDQVEPESQIERRPLDTSDCPICFEEFEQVKINSIDYCKTCGNNVHQECFNMWKASKGRDVSCVYCRSKWVFPQAQSQRAKKSVSSLDSDHRFEGRPNFALELGLDRKRDTSTFKTSKGYPHSFEDEDDGNGDNC